MMKQVSKKHARMIRLLIDAPERIAGGSMIWIISRTAVSNADPEKSDEGETNAETAVSGSAHGPVFVRTMIDESGDNYRYKHPIEFFGSIAI